MKMMTLWEAMTTKDVEGNTIIDGDIDLYDYNWDWEVAFCGDPDVFVADSDIFVSDSDSSEEESENYDKFLKWVAQHLVVDADTAGQYSIECNASDMIWAYHEVFEPFFNKHNRAGYRPKSYGEIDPSKDDGFYEVYMCSLASLISGGYSEGNYKELCEALNAASHDVTPDDYNKYLAFKEKVEDFRKGCQCTVYKQADEDVKDLWKEI